MGPDPKVARGSNERTRTRAAAPALVVAGLSGVLLGAGAWTFRYAEGFSYMSDDPKACVNCHVMRDQYDGWQKAPHHAVATCNDCHVPHDFIGKYLTKVEHGYRHSKGFTLNNFHEPIQIKPSSRKVVVNNCGRCHGEMVSQVEHAFASGESLDCIRCHRATAHGPVR